MNLKLEAIVVPVSDVDRAKKFYQEALGFRVDVDHRIMALKLVQLGLSGAAMFGANREVLQPSDVFLPLVLVNATSSIEIA